MPSKMRDDHPTPSAPVSAVHRDHDSSVVSALSVGGVEDIPVLIPPQPQSQPPLDTSAFPSSQIPPDRISPCQTNIKCPGAPPDMDPEVFAALPEDLKLEICRESRAALNNGAPDGEGVANRDNSQQGATQPHPPQLDPPQQRMNQRHSSYNIENSGFDFQALAELPDEILDDVLREEREEFARLRLEAALEYAENNTGDPPARQAEPEQGTMVEMPQTDAPPLPMRARSPSFSRSSSSPYPPAATTAPAPQPAAEPAPAQMTRTSSVKMPAGDYTGEINEMGERHGQGVLVSARSGSRYVGQFWNGFRDGKGTLTMSDGSTYEGWWKMDKCNGYGMRKFPGGGFYTGGYKNGERHGPGKQVFTNKDVYDGTFVKGCMTGKGRYIFVDGPKYDRTFGDHGFPKYTPDRECYYDGDFENGALHGYGRFVFGNGDSYEGYFNKGRKHGYGQYVYKKDRSLVECHFLNNAQFGIGVKWSAEKKKAWWFKGGKARGKLTPKDAEAIAVGLRKPAADSVAAGYGTATANIARGPGSGHEVV